MKISICLLLLFFLGLYSSASVMPGYFLLTPLFGQGEIVLVNQNKKKIHSWQVEPNPFYAKIHREFLVYSHLGDQTMRYQGITGQASEIKFIGGDSKVRFRYSDKYAHHDFDFASSDTLLVLRWVPLSKKEFSRIFGESTPYKQLWSDEVVGLKYKSQFRKVNSWSLSSFLDPDDLTKEQKNLILKGHELFHANAVSYSTTNPFNSLPAITVTARETNQVFVIDYRTGKLLWKSPKNFFSRPHDARITRDKTLTVYNNGAVDETSSVLEVDLLKNSVIWEYGSQLPLIVRWQFTSHELSGAQKLINGNFLVTHGVQGHIYEIDSEKKIVFSWPAAASFLKDILGHPAISLFKTEKIAVTKGQIQKLKGLE